MMPKDRVEAVDRALSLLEAFQEPGENITLAELSRRTGLYKSTLLRLLGSLQEFRMVSRRADGTYRLGSGIWRLASLYEADVIPAKLVRPQLSALAQATGETASFYVRDGSERLCLYRSNAPRALRHHLNEGARLPLDRGAAGRLLSAFDEPETSESKMIAETGYTLSLGERDDELAAIAAPVFEPDGGCVGALTISGPLIRFTDDMLDANISKVTSTARALTDALNA